MWELDISNIAGIRTGSPRVEPGINAVQASNWQGKTSLVTAIKTVLGGAITDATLTETESDGFVRLETPDETYEVSLSRRGDSVTRSGTPYLTDEQDRTCGDLFAFLDERNRIRTAVRNGEDLTPHLTEPLEQEDIDGRIQSLKRERRTVESELDDATRAKQQLPGVTEDITSLEAEVADLRAELETVDGNDDDVGDQEQLRQRLNEKRREYEQAKQRRSRLEQRIDSLESQIDSKTAELADIEVPDATDLTERLESKRADLQEIEAKIETLEGLYNINKRILDQGQVELVTDVTRQIDADHLSCWVCGNETTRDDIEAQMATLSDAVSDWRDRRSDLEAAVDDLETEKRSIKRKRHRKQSLEDEVESLRMTLEESRNDVELARETVETLADDVETLAERVAETDDRRSELEQEIARTEAKLEDRREKRAQLEERASAQEQLQERKAALSDEIESLRSRREETIATARTAFEAALSDVVDRFDPSFESARLEKHVSPDTGETERLELVIARDGRETSVDALSEGEVELVGIIAALAGHEAFDVADRVPCLLLDDVGGLAGDNLRTLVTYLAGRAEYVVTTAYPEVGEFDGHVISPADWDVVSDRTGATP